MSKSKQHIARLEHKKYVRFTKDATETIEDIINKLELEDYEQAIMELKLLIHGWKSQWSDYDKLSETLKNVYEQLAKEILAEIGLSDNI